MNAELIITNARIYSCDADFSIAPAMAVGQGMVLGLGDEAGLRSQHPRASLLDARGRALFPGFMDPHSHFLSYGYMLQRARLFGAASWAETVRRVIDFDKETRPELWVLGRGWDQNSWEDRRFPSKELLDEAFPDRPVFLTRIDGHAAIANSKALALAGIGPNCAVPGGEFVKRDGELSGLLIDNALDLVRQAIPPESASGKRKALLAAQKACFAAGLTSVSDAGTEYEDYQAMLAARREGELAIRLYIMLRPSPDNIERLIRQGPSMDEGISLRSIKLLVDGALGSRGSLLLEDYSDDPGNRGLRLDSAAMMDEACALALKHGFQVNTHCIGDAGLRLTLDLYEKYLRPGNDLRWRIEHAQIVDPRDLPRFGKLAVIPSIQSTHATSDMGWAGQRLGARLGNAYVYKSLLGQNGWLANGSDFPIERVEPLLGFYAAVARKDLAGKPEGGFQMENALGREEALRAMTIWAARANFEETSRGSLEPGKLADFVILDRDIMEVSESELPGTEVLATYLGGRPVYEA